MSIWERFNSMSTPTFFLVIFLIMVGSIGGGLTISYATNPEGTVQALQPEIQKVTKAKSYVSNLLE